MPEALDERDLVIPTDAQKLRQNHNRARCLRAETRAHVPNSGLFPVDQARG